MKKHIIVLLSCCLLTSFAFSQTIPQLVNEVNLDSLVKTVSEFAGEVPTVVNGNTVTILNRQQANNDLAADYLVQKLQRLDNLTVVNQSFNTNGHNIIATQIGKTNPNNIYIVSAHYDSVTNYCADDNASGVATVLEIARLLSTQCLDNTIVYALWDEEENGLNGSAYYANQAFANGDTILGVLNIDMMAYDGNNDMNFDIDVRNYANSLGMKDDILSILNNPTYGFSLVVNVVDPGTLDSDHASFWNKQYSAVLVGESWITNDHTPHYHMATDRLADFNLPYYHQLAKLIFGYMVTKTGLVAIDNTISATATTLTAAQNSASYQWYNCDTNLPIDGETAQSFSPNSNGSYAVEVTSGSCSEMSECFFF
jgi:Zn-dependent M28 family amino/carboxypeptidase